MHIWILRHGEAERETRHDPDRALTDCGKHDAKTVGELLAKETSEDLVVFVSPYKRAQQTAHAALKAMPQHSIITADWLQPESDPYDVIKQLDALSADEVLLVSHQPLVSALAGVLISGDYRDGPPMHTASLLELKLSQVGAGCAKLISLRHAPAFHKATI
jgi:phosphohistidine phosphatase